MGLVFDIGAYIGNKTQDYLSRGQRVIAVEPQPESAQTLRHRYWNNANVIVVEKAVTDKVGYADLITPNADLVTLSTLVPAKWYTGRFSKMYATHTFHVQTTTLDELIAEYGKPEFIKIDVEGSEEQVLRGLHQPVDKLTFEYSSDHLDSLNQCLNVLDALGSWQYSFSIGDAWFSLPTTRKYMEADLLDEVERDSNLWGDVVCEYQR